MLRYLLSIFYSLYCSDSTRHLCLCILIQIQFCTKNVDDDTFFLVKSMQWELRRLRDSLALLHILVLAATNFSSFHLPWVTNNYGILGRGDTNRSGYVYLSKEELKQSIIGARGISLLMSKKNVRDWSRNRAYDGLLIPILCISAVSVNASNMRRGRPGGGGCEGGLEGERVEEMHLNHKSKPTDVLAVEKIVENKYPPKSCTVISFGEKQRNWRKQILLSCVYVCVAYAATDLLYGPLNLWFSQNSQKRRDSQQDEVSRLVRPPIPRSICGAEIRCEVN